MNFIILIFGIICCSTSIIYIKNSTMESEFLASYRTLLAALLLIPICIYDYKTKSDIQIKNYLKISFIPGLLLAMHFISWMYGARLASPANSSLIVNLTPLATPFFLYFLIKEKLTRREIVGTLIAMCGVCILALSDFQTKSDLFLGDIICLISMTFFSLYLIFSCKNKNLQSLWIYVACLYAWCGVICFIAGVAILKNPFDNLNSNNIMQVFYLAAITTILGHSLLNYAMKHIRGQIVSVLNQFQFILGAVWGVIYFNTSPSTYFYHACCFLILGCMVAIYKPKKSAEQIIK